MTSGAFAMRAKVRSLAWDLTEGGGSIGPEPQLV
jgi:hypothetical protein